VRAREHITIFMTTHYMDEAEFCDRIAIIDQGKIVALGTPAELKTRVGGDVVTITTPDTALAAEQLRSIMHLGSTQVDGTLRVEVTESASFMPRLFSELTVPISAVSARRPSLDDVFLKLTGRAIREQESGALDQMRNMGRIWGGRR
jgi:ABC-2 type transport system ATP-binding protein